MQYTPEQVEDINKRAEKVVAFLKENEISVAATITKVRVGEDVFADKVTPILQDTKYAPKEVKSPFVDGADTEKTK